MTEFRFNILGEHLKEEFRNNVNRFKKVPAIVDNGFQLSESIAILRYLTNCYKFDDHWYPKNDQLRARVDEYLEWQHMNTRQYCAKYFAMHILMPRSPNPSAEEKDALASVESQANHILDVIEDLWLKPGCFIAGTNQISIADLIAICEIEQTSMHFIKIMTLFHINCVSIIFNGIFSGHRIRSNNKSTKTC